MSSLNLGRPQVMRPGLECDVKSVGTVTHDYCSSKAMDTARRWREALRDGMELGKISVLLQCPYLQQEEEKFVLTFLCLV
jgi:hypothetical protein